MKTFNQVFLFLFLISLLGCSKDSVQTPLFNGVKLIASGVAATGSGMTTKRGEEDRAVTPLNSDLCDGNARPQLSKNGGDMPESDGRYPVVFTYCALTVSDGDTVIGGFDLAKSLICSMEKGGIAFTGAPQAITMNLADTECWPKGGPEAGTTSLTITATGSSPASFNSHFDKGVEFSVDSIGLNFKIAANVDGDKIEFIASEDWSGAAAGDSLGDKGVMAGEITKSTGVLKFEKRDERIRASCTASRCGFNRHTRLRADLEMENGEPKSLKSFSYGYSDTQDKTIQTPPSASASGKVVTAQGALASEIKAILYSASGKTTAQIKTVGQWSEPAVTWGCGSAAGVSTSACSVETGIGLFTSDTKFLLYSSATHLSPATWASTFSGFNFTNVNLDTDQAF